MDNIYLLIHNKFYRWITWQLIKENILSIPFFNQIRTYFFRRKVIRETRNMNKWEAYCYKQNLANQYASRYLAITLLLLKFCMLSEDADEATFENVRITALTFDIIDYSENSKLKNWILGISYGETNTAILDEFLMSVGFKDIEVLA